MLERLRLQNFQIHDELDLDLSAPIVSITGQSDAGKSSVLRALRWIMTGQAPRSPMPTWGTDEVAAVLTVDSKRVERRKSKSENVYRLDGKEFAAVGKSDVPDEVARLLNVGQETFAGQHQSHFWLADTPGEVSRHLNGIVNLGLIDDALAAVASELRDAKHAEVSAGGRLEQAEGRVAELAWVEEANKVLQGLERTNEVLQAKRQEALELAQLVKVGRNAEEAARTAQAQTSRKETAIKRLSGMAERYAELSTESTGIGELLCDIRLKEKQAATARAAAERLEVELAAKVKVCPICRRPMPSSP